MKKLTTIAVAIGVMCLGIAVAGGSAAADEPIQAAPAVQGKHTLTFNRAINEANKLAQRECSRDVQCVAYAAGPTCTSSNRHKWDCPIHKLYGPSNGGVAPDPATQQDCVRPAQFLIKRATGRKLFYKFLSSTYTCGPNTTWLF